MFPSAADIPAVIAFVLPGFITLAILASLRGPRKRTQAEWLAWSITFSLVTYVLLSPITGGQTPTLSNPLPLALQFLIAVALGFAIHWSEKIPKVGSWISDLGAMTEPKVWNGLVEPNQWVQVRLKSGELLFGEVSQCSNDPNEERLELYLENVQAQDPDDQKTWTDLKATAGIYLPGDQISWVQIIKSRRAT